MDIARRIVALESEFARTQNIDTAKQIARLEREYALLAKPRTLEEAMDGPVDEGDVPDDPVEVGTYQDRIRSVLIRSAVAMTAVDIMAGIGPPNSLPTVRAILSRMCQSGSVERAAAGLYRATSAGHRSGGTDDDD